MKRMKRILAVLLAAVMVLAMGITVLAETTNVSGTNDNTGTITIQNAVKDQTYKLYQIFTLESYSYEQDISTGEMSDAAYAYTITSDSSWYDFVKPAEGDTPAGAGAAYVDLEFYKTENNISVYYVTWKDSDSDRAEFAKLALEYAAAEKIDPTRTAKAETAETGASVTENSDGTYTIAFSGLNLGYYLADSSLGALCSLNTTNAEALIEEKNAEPTNEKTVQEDSTGKYEKTNDADIGQVVAFRTAITVQAGAEKYVLHDKMSDGLAYQGITSVVLKQADQNEVSLIGKSDSVTEKYSASTPGGYTYEVTAPGKETDQTCTFEMEFVQEYLDTLKAGSQIVVTYTARVTSDAVVGEANTNETWLDYGDESTTAISTTETYTWALNIFKHNSSKKGLAGAEFVLYKTEEDGTKYYAVISNGKLTGWTKNSTDKRTEDSDDNSFATVLTSDSDGKIAIQGLDADTYYLEERTAPKGYNKLAGPVKIVIEAEKNAASDTMNEKVTYYDYDNYNGTGTPASDLTVKVLNKTGSLLPSTGGMGTAIFYIVGGILVIVAAVLLIVRRRMRSEK